MSRSASSNIVDKELDSIEAGIESLHDFYVEGYEITTSHVEFMLKLKEDLELLANKIFSSLE